MEFTIGRGHLRHIAAALTELDEVIVSPSRGSIVAYDTAHTRRISYTPEGIKSEDGHDRGLDAAAISKVAKRVRGEARVSLTGEYLVAESGNTTYKIRLLMPAAYMEEPKTTCTGKVSLPGSDLSVALKDVQAGGAAAVVIAVDEGTAMFRGEGDTDCWITAPDAETEGRGYSRLDLGLLLPCVPNDPDCVVTVTLSPKGPTTMQFGDDLLYHQGARL